MLYEIIIIIIYYWNLNSINILDEIFLCLCWPLSEEYTIQFKVLTRIAQMTQLLWCMTILYNQLHCICSSPLQWPEIYDTSKNVQRVSIVTWPSIKAVHKHVKEFEWHGDWYTTSNQCTLYFNSCLKICINIYTRLELLIYFVTGVLNPNNQYNKLLN